MDRFDEIAVEAARSGLAVNAGRLRADELCRQQNDRLAEGYLDLIVYRNIYGWTFRATHNNYNGGNAIADARTLKTLDNAIRAACEFCERDPGKRQLFRVQIGYPHMIERVADQGWQLVNIAKEKRQVCSNILGLPEIIAASRERGLVTEE